MGTPASIRVFQSNGDCLVHIYAQNSGYPEDVGLDVANILVDMVRLDGCIDYQKANGAEDLAAILITKLKPKFSMWGGIYLVPYSEKKTQWGWEYRYDIEVDEQQKVWVRAKNGRRSLFSGDLSAFVAFCIKKKEAYKKQLAKI